MKLISEPTERTPFILERDSLEWEEAWSELSRDKINDGIADKMTAECSLTGEVWQYMGSFQGKLGSTHQFRHRHHPSVNRRVVKNIFFHDVPDLLSRTASA